MLEATPDRSTAVGTDGEEAKYPGALIDRFGHRNQGRPELVSGAQSLLDLDFDRLASGHHQPDVVSAGSRLGLDADEEIVREIFEPADRLRAQHVYESYCGDRGLEIEAAPGRRASGLPPRFLCRCSRPAHARSPFWTVAPPASAAAFSTIFIC